MWLQQNQGLLLQALRQASSCTFQDCLEYSVANSLRQSLVLPQGSLGRATFRMAAKAPAVASYLWGQKAAWGSFLSCPSTDGVLGVWGLCLMAKGALFPTLELFSPSALPSSCATSFPWGLSSSFSLLTLSGLFLFLLPTKEPKPRLSHLSLVTVLQLGKDKGKVFPL